MIGTSHWKGKGGECHQLIEEGPWFGPPGPSLELSGELEGGMSQLLYRPFILGRCPLSLKRWYQHWCPRSLAQ